MSEGMPPGSKGADGSVFIMKSGAEWSASWQKDDGVAGEYQGSRDDAISWAKLRTNRVWIYSEEVGDLVLVTSDGRVHAENSFTARNGTAVPPPIAPSEGEPNRHPREPYRDYL